MQRERGFTIPELVAVIGVVIVLVAVSLVWTRPKDFTAANDDAKRQTDVAALLQAINRYHADKGHLPEGITAKPKLIGGTEDGVDLCALLVPKYIKDLPADPVLNGQYPKGVCMSTTAEDPYTTGYTIQQETEGLTLSAPLTENATVVSITRAF